MDQPGQWASFQISGHENVPCQAAYTQNGKVLNAWVKFRPPGRPEMTVHADLDLAQLEKEIAPIMQAEMAQQMGIPDGGAAAGWGFAKKLMGKVKKAAKKIGKNKVLRAVVDKTRKALDNPMVQQALASHPYGQSFLAARAAARVTAKALKGAPKAKAAIARTVAAARQGDPRAANMMQLFNQSARQLTNANQAMARFSGDGDEYVLDLMRGPALTQIGCAGWHAGGEDAELQAELSTIDEFTPATASAGAWEGVKWAAHALAAHPINPSGLTARGALLDGRAAMARRWA